MNMALYIDQMAFILVLYSPKEYGIFIRHIKIVVYNNQPNITGII